MIIPQIDWHKYLSIVLTRPAQMSEPVVIFALQYMQNLIHLLSKTTSRYNFNLQYGLYKNISNIALNVKKNV